MRALCLHRRSKSPPHVGTMGVDMKIERARGRIVLEDHIGDLTDDMAQIIVPERALGPAEQIGMVALRGE